MSLSFTVSLVKRFTLAVVVAMIGSTFVASETHFNGSTDWSDDRLLIQADSLYANRADISQVKEAIQLLQKARGKADNYDVNWRLAKFNYYLATHTKDKTERDTALNLGTEAGRISVRANAQDPAGHFWLGANLGEKARLHGGFKALGLVDDVQREMETVIRLSEGYQDGSAYMVLGQIDLRLPGLFGGSKKRAVERLEKGLSFGKTNAFLRLRLAEAYLAVKRTEEARSQLDQILSMGPHPDYKPEYEEAVAEARRILTERFK